MSEAGRSRAQTRRTRLAPFVFVLAMAPAWAEPVLEGAAVRSGRVAFTVDGSGLPATITIPPRASELPLGHRGDEPPADVLARIGRGPLLRAPLRLEAVIDGKPVAAEIKEAAKPAAGEAAVRGQATLAAGPLAITATVTYRDTALVEIELQTAGDATVGGLRLVVPLAGTVDLAIPLAAAAAAPDAPLGAFTPATIDGVVWSSAKGNGSPAVVPAPGLATPVFFGSGDRGFVWTASDAADWPLDPAGASFELVRDQAGAIEAHCWLANQPGGLAARRSFKGSLQVLPATAAEPPGRAAAWRSPPADGRPATDNLAKPIVTGSVAVPATAVFLPDGRLGGSELFRYLSAAPAGLPGVVQAAAERRQAAGAAPSETRALIGRALLHGLVVDGTGVAHRADLLKAVRALAACGLFDDSLPVETVPYWRSAGLARYGEAYEPDAGFEIASSDPVARVHTAAFVMPRGNGADAPRQTLFVIVNEGDRPVRQQFYVTDPKAAFGGANRTSSKQIVAGYDDAGLPPESDWRKDSLLGMTPGKPTMIDQVLLDLEDGGYVIQTKADAALEVYGPVFIGPRSYRLLWGCGEAGPLPVPAGGQR